MEDKNKTISLCIALLIIVIADGYIVEQSNYSKICDPTETSPCYNNAVGKTVPMDFDRYFSEHNVTASIVLDDSTAKLLFHK